MYKLVGRCDTDSIIDSLPGDSASRIMLREAVARWGDDFLFAFKDMQMAHLTDMTQSHRLPGENDAMTKSRSAYESGLEQPMLSESLAPALLGGRWLAPSDVPNEFSEATASYGAMFRAPGTWRRYYCAYKSVIRLCLKANVCPAPMSVGTAIGVMCEIASSGLSYSSVKAAREAISFVHLNLNMDDPTKSAQFARIWAGITRKLGTGNPCRKIALTRQEIGQMIDIAMKRHRPDHAVAMAVSFEGALRVSELCKLQVKDVLWLYRSATLLITRSKCDQTGRGESVDLELREGAPFDASAMLYEWMSYLGREAGHLFSPLRAGRPAACPLNVRTFTRMVKFYAACIGLDPKDVGSHSMRAGWVTEELDLRRPEIEVAGHLRHGSLDMLLRYYRPRRAPRNLVSFAHNGAK